MHCTTYFWVTLVLWKSEPCISVLNNPFDGPTSFLGQVQEPDVCLDELFCRAMMREKGQDDGLW